MIRILCWLALGLLPFLAQAQDPQRAPVKVMLVLDGSGSMWGQLENRPKIEIAREVLGDLLSLWDSSHQVGLTVYGHRRKGDCEDIETLVPIGGTTDSVRDAASKINPKGKTPISAAVTQAAEALAYTEDAATVILISDGAETCDADPCAVGRALEEKGVDFTAHVVGFDVAESEQAGLRCLAETTGGLFLAAANAAALSDALKKTVEKTKMPEPPRPPPKSEAGPLKLRAMYAEGGPQIKRGTTWEVLQAAQGIEGKRKKLGFSYDVEPEFKLEPGDYVLALKVGAAKIEQALSVDGSGGTRDIVLDAGLLQMQGRRTSGADLISKGTTWEVLNAATDIEGKSQKVTFSYEAQPTFTLPSGKYQVTLKVGSAKAETDVEVRAGERSEGQIVLNSGIAALSAVLKPGDAPTQKLSWNVYAAENNIDGSKPASVTFSYDNQPQWELKAGKYRVTAKRGAARSEVEIEVTAGQRTEAQVVLNAGVLKAGSTGGSGSHSWTVFSLGSGIDRQDSKVTFSYDAEPEWTLPAGDYIVRLKRGVLAAETTASVSAGQASTASIDLQ